MVGEGCQRGGDTGLGRKENFKGISLKLLIKVRGILRPLKLGVLQQVLIWEPMRGGRLRVCLSPRFIKHNAFKMPGPRRLTLPPSPRSPSGLAPTAPSRWRPRRPWVSRSSLGGLCTEKRCSSVSSLRVSCRGSGAPEDSTSQRVLVQGNLHIEFSCEPRRQHPACRTEDECDGCAFAQRRPHGRAELQRHAPQ